MKLLKDPQIILFCLLYFAIQLTIYAATFWLPTIIRKMGDLTDFQIGLFNAIPWLIAMVAMYFFAVWSAKLGFQQAWLAASLVIAAIGLFASTSDNPVFSFVAICFSAISFKAAPRQRSKSESRAADSDRANQGALKVPNGIRDHGTLKKLFCPSVKLCRR